MIGSVHIPLKSKDVLSFKKDLLPDDCNKESITTGRCVFRARGEGAVNRVNLFSVCMVEDRTDNGNYNLDLIQARRTAFVARFIVLRESRRTRAHRTIEKMEWESDTTAEELAKRFREVFVKNGDNMVPVDRDLRRALAHADRSLKHFVDEYVIRATTNFIEALCDYERSNQLLFGEGEQPKSGGWRLIQELIKEREEEKQREKEKREAEADNILLRYLDSGSFSKIN